jgi:hypothetical protein
MLLSMATSATQIQEIAPPTKADFFRLYVKRSRPVVLKGAIRDWPAATKWSPAYFREAFGTREVPVAEADPQGHFYDAKKGFHYARWKISDYVDAMEGKSPAAQYLSAPVIEFLPELFDDIRMPAYCERSGWSRSRFWFAGRGTVTPMHRDLPENLYAQVTGRKRFIFFDRREARNMYSHSILSGVPNESRVDPERPDLKRFPRFAKATRYEGVVEAGDLLYIPSLWWHHATALETSLSINLWWADGLLSVPVRAAALFGTLRQLKL